MASPSRFTSGVTNALPNSNLNQYGLPDPASWNTYFNDFNSYRLLDWTVTEVGAATQALLDADGGVLRIANASADNDSSFMQLVGEAFLFETGKRMLFKAKFQLNEAVESEFVMGLQITDTSPLAVTDGVYFRKDDGDANIDFVVISGGVSTEVTAVATLADDTDIVLGFYYDGKSKVQYFIDNVVAGSVVVDNLPLVEELTPSLGIQNGEAADTIMLLDYVFASKER